MQLGYIGLGKMGSNMVERLLENKHEVTVYDRDRHAVAGTWRERARGRQPPSRTWLRDFASPRSSGSWFRIRRSNAVLSELVPLLAKGDTVIDGGNSPYKESIRRSRELEEKGHRFSGRRRERRAAGRAERSVHHGRRQGGPVRRYDELSSAISPSSRATPTWGRSAPGIS